MTTDLRRRRLLGLGGAGVVAVVVTVVVVLFGVAPYPDVPRLADEPGPAVPGWLAYVRHEPNGTCAYIAGGDGVEHEVRCVNHDLEVRWDDQGRLELRRYLDGTMTVDVTDPTTGDVVETRTQPIDPERPFPAIGSPVREDGARLDVEIEGSTVRIVVIGEGRRALWETTGPVGYRLEEPTWSPSGEWVLTRDSRQFLIVLHATGDPAPRVWVEDVWQVDWYEPGA